jgi:hypothetical protein
MHGKRDHFVPRHYLRQFRFEETDQIAIATVEPFKFIGLGRIDRQCQEDYFYERDQALNEILWQFENNIAPVLLCVTQHMEFDAKERSALNMLAVLLHTRTKSAVEQAKVFPKRIAYEVIKSAIESGKLPETKGGWKEGMMDFQGIPGLLIQTATIPCWMEMQTLECKLLSAPERSSFITSDHPVVILNQFCADAEPHRSFAGFSRSGFQLLMPISPNLCSYFYDPKVYKVGSRRHQCLNISGRDVEIVNALQIQSAEKCLYFHTPKLAPQLESLVARYGHLRVPIQDSLRTLPGRNEHEKFLHIRAKSVKLPAPWTFCHYRRRITSKIGSRRDDAWSASIELLIRDIEQKPLGREENLFMRHRRVIDMM